MTTADLIERLEKEGPSRELDTEIQRLVDPERDKYCYAMAQNLKQAARDNGLTDRDDAARRSAYSSTPQFTSSIDSALTLVPEGAYGFAYPWFYSEYSRYEKPCVFWRAAIHKPIWEKATPTLAQNDWFDRWECASDVVNPAIALCIACLRARAGGVK
jgi:hypothetical protein